VSEKERVVKRILITDTLFIGPRDEQRLEQKGFVMERLAKPDASEDELIEHLHDKDGYILGGIETVTVPVLDAAIDLKAIVFTGSGYEEHIPAYEHATAKGIAISNTPGAVSDSVAEYTLLLMLLMNRRSLQLGRTGDAQFLTTHELSGETVGIVGMGSVGRRVASLLHSFSVGKILYNSRSVQPEIEKAYGATFCELPQLLQSASIVSLHRSQRAGMHYFDSDALSKMRDGALLINASFADAVDPDALLKELTAGRLRAAFDGPPQGSFGNLPLDNWFSSNGQSGFNTVEAVGRVSEMATTSLINLLTSGSDEHRVN
jgi:phosphoglycerate dehydrogenase-like enzyme